jgi:hypothetical protein
MKLHIDLSVCHTSVNIYPVVHKMKVWIQNVQRNLQMKIKLSTLMEESGLIRLTEGMRFTISPNCVNAGAI